MGGFFFAERIATLPLALVSAPLRRGFLVPPNGLRGSWGGVAVNPMANDTGNSGPGPAQVDLPGSFPGWLSSPRDHSTARGHLPSRALPYGRERYEARWPLVMCLEEVGTVLRARPCKMAGTAGCYVRGKQR